LKAKNEMLDDILVSEEDWFRENSRFLTKYTPSPRG
jgi:hypothetical protein